jgi:hypothetical protein
MVLYQWMKYKNVFISSCCTKVTLDGESVVAKIDLEPSLLARLWIKIWRHSDV